MKGTRPLSDTEIVRVSEAFEGRYAVRNRGLFKLGVSTGGRISELLGLKIGDVWQKGRAVSDLLFDKSIVKGGEVSRAVYVNSDGRAAIETLIAWHGEMYNSVASVRFLFPSQKCKGATAMRRQSAHDILKAAFESAGLNGKVATHSMRKSYAQRLYHRTGDIFTVSAVLGHKNIATTQAYLGVDYQTLRSASESMSLFENRGDTSALLCDVPDDTLLVELVRRGYDISLLVKQGEKA